MSEEIIESEIIIEKDYFRIWPKSFYPKTTRELYGVGSILSIFSPWLIDGSIGNCTAAVTFGIFEDHKDKINLVLFSMFTPKPNVNPGELITHCKNLSHNYLNNSLIRSYDGYPPDVVLIPADESSKNVILTEIKREVKDSRVAGFYYKKYGADLDSMLIKAMPKICQKKIWVVSKPGDPNTLRSLDEVFLAFVCGYPSTAHSRALVWALCQVVLFLDARGAFNGIDLGPKKPKEGVYGAIK